MRRLALCDAARVEPVERPHAGIDRQLLLRRAERHVIPVRDAVTVGDDERRPGVRFRFEQRLHRLRHLGAHRDPRHVDVAIHAGEQAEILLAGGLARRGELGNRAERRRFRLLAAGVRIDLRVEHEDVDVAATGEHVVEAAIADVIGPTVAAQQPDALLDEVVGQRLEPARLRRIDRAGASRAMPAPARAARRCPPRSVWSAFSSSTARLSPSAVRQPLDQRARRRLMRVHAQPQPEAEFRVVFEQRIRPCRPAAVAIGRVRRGRQIAAVNRRAAGGVGDQQAIAEQLREQLDVRRFAAARAGARVLEQRLEELRALVIDPRSGRRGRSPADRGRTSSSRRSGSRSGACGRMSMALCFGLVRSLAGQTFTHRLQPVQSSGAT